LLPNESSLSSRRPPSLKRSKITAAVSSVTASPLMWWPRLIRPGWLSTFAPRDVVAASDADVRTGFVQFRKTFAASSWKLSGLIDAIRARRRFRKTAARIVAHATLRHATDSEAADVGFGLVVDDVFVAAQQRINFFAPFVVALAPGFAILLFDLLAARFFELVIGRELRFANSLDVNGRKQN
jgi:hypothetical protein